MKKKRQDFGSFNIISFLDEFGISYKTSGKNIANGWLGIEECPFCSGSGFHFGVRLSNSVGSCWLCGEKANAFRIVSTLLNVSNKETFQIIKQFSSDDIRWIPETDKTGKEVIFPDGITEKLTKKAKSYLIGRNYNPDLLMEQFKIKSTDGYSTLYVEDREWDFSNRILVPVFINRRIQCYLGRDFTGEKDPKYMNSPVVASIIAPHHCIYNYDTLKGKVIFVEGVTDVWRLGAKVGAFLGITYTPAQIRLLLERDIQEATVLFDKGAEKRANKLAHAIYSIVPKVRTAYISESDPGSMDQIEAMKTKYELIGEV